MTNEQKADLAYPGYDTDLVHVPGMGERDLTPGERQDRAVSASGHLAVKRRVDTASSIESTEMPELPTAAEMGVGDTMRPLGFGIAQHAERYTNLRTSRRTF